jgi:hypothetical protein
VVADTCLCEYTSHGHCGLVSPEGEVQNDPTLELLARTALAHGQGRSRHGRPLGHDGRPGGGHPHRLWTKAEPFLNTPIMSYAVKYASAFYGPFRDAAECAPKFGDRKTYQMDPANWREGLREAAADVEEGADILMVKPAWPILDIIRLVRDEFDLPVAAYQVSGEYSHDQGRRPKRLDRRGRPWRWKPHRLQAGRGRPDPVLLHPRPAQGGTRLLRMNTTSSSRRNRPRWIPGRASGRTSRWTPGQGPSRLGKPGMHGHPCPTAPRPASSSPGK